MADKISSPRRSQDPTRSSPPADSSQPGVERHRGRSGGLILLMCGLSLLLIGLNGCGLSGGSVPIGDGPKTSLQGVVMLPGGPLAAGATVVVRTLPSFQVVQTTTTEAAGVFVATNVPTGGDLEVVVSATNGATLKAVVPHAGLAANSGPQALNIGTISVFSTETATSIELEIAARPSDTATIVVTQFAPLAETDGESVGGMGGGQPVVLRLRNSPMTFF